MSSKDNKKINRLLRSDLDFGKKFKSELVPVLKAAALNAAAQFSDSNILSVYNLSSMSEIRSVHLHMS